MTRAARAYRLVRCALVVCLLAAGGLVLGAGPASADELTPITHGTTVPVSTSRVGTPFAQLGRSTAEYPARGGWTGGRAFVTNPQSGGGPLRPGYQVLSETWLLSEPYQVNGQTNFQITLGGSRPDTDGAGGTLFVRHYALEVVQYCRYSDVSTSSVTKSYRGHMKWDTGQGEQFPNRIQTADFRATCPLTSGGVSGRLVALEVFAHTLWYGGTHPAANPSQEQIDQNWGGWVQGCSDTDPSRANPRFPASTFLCNGALVGETSRHVWYPDLVIDYGPYDDDLPDYGDDNPGIDCRVNPSAAQCDIINRWNPYEDATDFDKVCAGAPSWSWTSVDWVPEWVGHYTACLFKPKAGFPSDPVMFELERSTVGTVTAQIKEVADALPKAESCGVLFSSDAFGTGTAFSLDTCTWGDWSTAKTWIGYAALVLAGINGLNMLLGTLMSRSMRPDGE